MFMGLMSDYIKRGLSVNDLETELVELIKKYNQNRKTFLVLYVADIYKPIPRVLLEQEDYYIIHDLLRNTKSESVDFYLATPGGSAESAEEIVKCLRSKFSSVSFVISGEAKSAGTIMVLSADEILMTETGSLGPIDAQVNIGRSRVSAYDYLEWTEEKRKEAAKIGRLNPFDAIMIAQINPGEISGVHHSLEYAKDLVSNWLVKYKFHKWITTETRKIPVTQEMKEQKAKDIAKEFAQHSKWRSHGRSIKIGDLRNIGLQVTKIEDNPELADIVYRIQTVCRLILESTTAYKIFATEDDKVFKHASATGNIGGGVQQIIPDAAELEIKCPQCGILHKIYAKFINNPKIDEDMKRQGRVTFPKDNKLKCSCGFEVDLSGFRNDIESKTRRKIILSD
ncbi:MAG: ATP-dependent Clp protease proteolytic subunit [Dehalococcoidales bacterium]|nr:ATP-dependent Clp protease proteolytic subunit [Dehalococcoidales bacterium]